MTSRVMVVDDEKSIRFTFEEFIRKDGYEVYSAGNFDEAIELMGKYEFDIIVTDIVMPGLSGVDLLKEIRRAASDIIVIMITGEPTVDTAAEAARVGAFDYLTKPVSGENLRNVVRNASRVKVLSDEKKRLEEENRRYQEHLEDLVDERTLELRESEERYRTLVEGAGQPIYMIGRDGTFLFMNNVAAGRLGGSPGDFIGKTTWDVYPKEEADTHMSRITAAIESGKPVLAESSSERDGERFWFDERIHPLTNVDGKTDSVLAIVTDITEQRRALKDARIEREKRKNVVLNTAHLLHTPLTVVKGNLELVRNGTKELTTELIDRLLERLMEMHRLIKGELYRKIDLMIVETSDGFTPATGGIQDCDEEGKE